MRIVSLMAMLLATVVGRASAGPFYDLSVSASSATMRVSGVIKVNASSATPNTPTITLNGATGAITATSVAGDGSLLTGIPAAGLASSAVTTPKIATDAVTSTKILNGEVTTPKLATDSVLAAAIIDGAVTTNKLASGAVTTGKVAADAILGSSILNATITTAKLNADIQARLTTNIYSSLVSVAVVGTTNAGDAVDVTFTPNGSSNAQHYGIYSDYLAGYTGNSGTAALYGNATTAGNQVAAGVVGRGYVNAASKKTVGVVGEATSQNSGDSSSINIGGWFRGGNNVAATPGRNVGVVGSAMHRGTVSNYGGYFALSGEGDSSGVLASDVNSFSIIAGTAAVTADIRGNAPADIFHGVNNGVVVTTFTAIGGWRPVQKTKAQIDVLTPTLGTGEYIFCTDCTIPGLCVSTGTAVAQWRRDFSATVGCGTNN